MPYLYPERGLTRFVAPAAEPVTLSEAKLYLRVDGSGEDTLITDLIAAARIAAEEYLDASFISQSWKLTYNDYAPIVTKLPHGPVQAITSVTAYGRDGSSAVLSGSGYYVSASREDLVFDALVQAHRIEIVYTAGFGPAASDVPKTVKQGMLAHLATLYDARDAGADMPPAALGFYRPFREFRI